ncbi:radical SAM protein [Candidatus Bathycorpusculum sp.]|uniref:radical SAM protein n=1 Tax=Candidatus Bathycorpusculum sp. TaxID=2994959 RepID=UPI00281994C6|nr:radical SAM protein [Candidatus Termitimicrobium sp.]MCL2432503.1 radical SAM protein [Candidatus Termitimicrobium sp.]
MQSINAETVWNLNHTALHLLLVSGCLKPQSKTVRFYAPSFVYYKTKYFSSSTQEFAMVSVTGNACTLNCKHCGGKPLQTMHPATSPQELYKLGLKLRLDGTKGMLISGGCQPNGSVPLDNFIPVLAQLKTELGFTLFVHTGIIRRDTAFLLKQAGIDAALIDVIGSQNTFQKTFNLKINLQEHITSLKSLHDAQLKVIPHLIVGLNDGKLEGEYTALRLIKENLNPAAIVILAFMPLHGTEMAQTPPPQPLDIAKTIAVARTMFPQTPLALGCMRPKGKHRAQTDILALKAGVDAVAFPSPEAIAYAQKSGYNPILSSYCCAQLHQDFQPKP